MRRLLAVIVAVVALVAACHSSTSNGVHWRQNRAGQERVIDVVMSSQLAADQAFRAGIEHGIAVWNPSPFIDFRLVIADGCTPGVHCVTVARQVGLNGAGTGWGWDSELHMHGRAARMTFDAAPWDPAVLRNGACHELGHALALSHSDDGTDGPCQGGQPTAHDRTLVDDNHAHSDGGGLFSFSVDNAGPGEAEHHDTYAELERGAHGRRR